MNTNTVNLEVSFNQKEYAKQAAWDNDTEIKFNFDNKNWYWEGEGELPEALREYLPESEKQDKEVEPTLTYLSIPYKEKNEVKQDAWKAGFKLQWNENSRLWTCEHTKELPEWLASYETKLGNSEVKAEAKPVVKVESAKTYSIIITGGEPSYNNENHIALAHLPLSLSAGNIESAIELIKQTLPKAIERHQDMLNRHGKAYEDGKKKTLTIRVSESHRQPSFIRRYESDDVAAFQVYSFEAGIKGLFN